MGPNQAAAETGVVSSTVAFGLSEATAAFDEAAVGEIDALAGTSLAVPLSNLAFLRFLRRAVAHN